jgi:hypothetical protein
MDVNQLLWYALAESDTPVGVKLLDRFLPTRDPHEPRGLQCQSLGEGRQQK